MFESPLFPLLLMIPVFYFLILRPQQQERKRTQQMLEALKKGDRVLTSGGIYGTVQSIENDQVALKIGDANRVEFSKSAIAKVVEAETKKD